MIQLVLALVLCSTPTPPEALAQARRGASLAAAGKIAEAREALEKAHALAPKDAGITYNLAQVQEASGALVDAIGSYQAYLELAPSAPDASDVRARLVRLRAAIEEVPDEARQKLLKGKKLFEAQRFDDALSAFLEAERLAPNWGAPQYNLGVSYEAMGRFDEARDRFVRYRPFATTNEQEKIDEKIIDLEIKKEDAEKKAAAEKKKKEAELEAEEKMRKAKKEEQEREAAISKRKSEQYDWLYIVAAIVLPLVLVLALTEGIN